MSSSPAMKLSTVLQEDRIAAADWAGDEETAGRILAGELDEHILVQSYVKHREKAECRVARLVRNMAHAERANYEFIGDKLSAAGIRSLTKVAALHAAADAIEQQHIVKPAIKRM